MNDMNGTARYDHDDALIIHISDTHISAPGVNPARPNPQYDARKALDADCARIAASGLRPDLIVVTGDLCDAETGERAREAYRHVRERVGELGTRLGCPVAYAMGNHDDREAFRAELLEPLTQTTPVDGVSVTIRSDDTDSPVDYVMTVSALSGTLRAVVLDTSVPDPDDDTGVISDEQLVWLDGLLKTPTDTGTVLVMHHPPVAPWQDRARLWQMDPAAAERLAPVVRGRVRAILCGHVHLASAATFAGTPVSIAAAHSRNQDPMHARDLTYSWAANYGSNLVLLRGTPADPDQVLITPALITPDSVAD